MVVIRLNNAGKWACDQLTEDADFGKKNYHLFRWSSFWSWRVCKQANFSHLGQRQPARIDWKADALKTAHCLMRILIQRHNWAIFLRKWVRSSCYSQRRLLSGHVERISKTEEQDIGNIWFPQDTAKAVCSVNSKVYCIKAKMWLC